MADGRPTRGTLGSGHAPIPLADTVKNYSKAKRKQLRDSGLALSDVSPIKNLGATTGARR